MKTEGLLSGCILEVSEPGHLCPCEGCPRVYEQQTCSQQLPLGRNGSLEWRDDAAECQLVEDGKAEALRQVPRLMSGKSPVSLCCRSRSETWERDCSISIQVASASLDHPWFTAVECLLFLLVTSVPWSLWLTSKASLGLLLPLCNASGWCGSWKEVLDHGRG